MNFLVTRRLAGAAVLLGSSVLGVSVFGCSSPASEDSGAGPGGNGGSNGTAGAGPGGAAGLPDKIVGPRGQAFVPADIELKYVGNGSSQGLEIVAATLLQSSGAFEEPAWFVAVRNTGLETICSVYISAEFFDASETSLGVTSLNDLSTPMFIGPSGFESCLGPDDVGMVEIESGLTDVIVADVARIDYAFTAFVKDDMRRITSVRFENLEPITDAYDEVAMKGGLKNGLSATIYGPRVDFFAVDALGRPYARMWTFEAVEIAPNESWSFTTLSLHAQLDGYVSYSHFYEPL